MGSDPFIFSFFLIFACAGILATLALYTRQPLIVTYIVTGMILGPSGAALIDNPQLISSISKFGIIFLLFLLGLDMQPAKLMTTLRSALLVGIGSSIIFFLLGSGIAHLFGYGMTETLIIGVSMMFSSNYYRDQTAPYDRVASSSYRGTDCQFAADPGPDRHYCTLGDNRRVS